MSNLFPAIREDDAQKLYVGHVAASGQRNLPPGGEAGLVHILASIRSDDRRIIDLGCNTGYVAHSIAMAHPEVSVCGLDIDPRMIEAARSANHVDRGTLEFVESDGRTVAEACGPADLIVCAGSSAFFLQPIEMFKQVRDALRPGGRFIDGLYLYDSDTPADLRRTERQAFGLGWTPDNLDEALAAYAAAGLKPVKLIAMPSFVPDTSEEVVSIREILRQIPAIRSVVEEIEARLELIGTLSKHRQAIFVELVRKEDNALFHTPAEVRDWSDIAGLQAHFQAGQEPVSIADLRAMQPHQVLAYFGDTDAAPGGGKSVTDLSRRLSALGLNRNAAVLDVGCFTGLSTVALAQQFPNVVGIDIDPKSIAIAQRCAAPLAPTAKFALADGANLGGKGNRFDAIIMTATLGYTDDPVAMLNECYRLLKPGGFFAEFVYHHDWLDVALRETVGENLRFLTLGRSLTEFTDAGFRPLAIERIPIPNCAVEQACEYYNFVEELEAARDPAKSAAELTEAISLYRLYSLEHSQGDRADTICYQCIFTKPGE